MLSEGSVQMPILMQQADSCGPEWWRNGEGKPSCMGSVTALKVLQIDLYIYTARGLGAGCPRGRKCPYIIWPYPAKASAAQGTHSHSLMLDWQATCISTNVSLLAAIVSSRSFHEQHKELVSVHCVMLH